MQDDLPPRRNQLIGIARSVLLILAGCVFLMGAGAVLASFIQ